MSEELKEKLLDSIFCIRDAISNFHIILGKELAKWDVSINELVVMREIQDNAVGSDRNTRMSDIQNQLNVSKAAVSKMLGVLERKGYVYRDIDKENRRNLIITLTPTGKNVLKEFAQKADALVEKIMLHLGKDQSEQFVESVNCFVSAMDDVAKSPSCPVPLR